MAALVSLDIEEEVKSKPLNKKVRFEMEPLSLQEAPEDKNPAAKDSEVTAVIMDAAHKLLTQEEDYYKTMSFKEVSCDKKEDTSAVTVSTVSDAALTDFCQRREIEDLSKKLMDMRIFWGVFIAEMFFIALFLFIIATSSFKYLIS